MPSCTLSGAGLPIPIYAQVEHASHPALRGVFFAVKLMLTLTFLHYFCSCWQHHHQADRAQRQRELRENQTSLFDSVLDREGTGATGGGGTDGRRSRRVAPAAAGTPAAAAAAFPFASAAMGAASAARKSHLDVGTGEERRRLEREAFRVSVHEHVRRELVKTSIEDTRALAAMARVLSEDVADRQSPIVAVFTSSLLQLVHESLVALGLGFQ